MTEIKKHWASSRLNNKEKPQPGYTVIETEVVWIQMDERRAEQFCCLVLAWFSFSICFVLEIIYETPTYIKWEKELQLKLAVSCLVTFMTCPAPPLDRLQEVKVMLATSSVQGRVQWPEGDITRHNLVQEWAAIGSTTSVSQQVLALAGVLPYNIPGKVNFSVLCKSLLISSDACRFHTFLCVHAILKISSYFQLSWSYFNRQNESFSLVKTEVLFLPSFSCNRHCLHA